jgi:hypothetical protein
MDSTGFIPWTPLLTPPDDFELQSDLQSRSKPSKQRASPIDIPFQFNRPMHLFDARIQAMSFQNFKPFPSQIPVLEMPG